MEKFCATCFYALDGDEPKAFNCRRYPPQGFPTQRQNPLTQQVEMGFLSSYPPVTAITPACGEYKSKIAAVNGELES
jgi:hypothetical protein